MEELMYKPGDKVMVRPDLNCDHDYVMKSGPKIGESTYRVVPSMVYQAGKIFTIDRLNEGGKGYRLKEFDFSWNDEMFLPITNECFCESLL